MQLQLYYYYIHILCTNSSYYYCYCWFWLLLLVRWELEIPTKFCYIYERVVAVGKRYGFLIQKYVVCALNNSVYYLVYKYLLLNIRQVNNYFQFCLLKKWAFLNFSIWSLQQLNSSNRGSSVSNICSFYLTLYIFFTVQAISICIGSIAELFFVNQP